MRKSIDTYIKAIAHDNEQVIRENYMTVADYIITAIMSISMTRSLTRQANLLRLKSRS